MVGDKSTNKKRICVFVIDFLNLVNIFTFTRKVIAPTNNNNNITLAPCLIFKKTMGNKNKRVLKILASKLII
jgi:hypothetical protein